MKKYIATRVATMFGVLLITLLITIILVGSNMDTILKQGIVFQVRSEIIENPAIAESFSSVKEFEAFIDKQTDERIKNLGLDEPWHSPQRIGFTMYKIILLDFGQATFLTSDLGSSDVRDIIFEKLPRTILLFTSATIIISIIGIFVGALSASKIGSTIDRITSSFAIISSSFPVWWIGMLMIFLFAFTYQIFPASNTRYSIIKSRIFSDFIVSYDITINHNSDDRIWIMGIFGEKFHGRYNARRFHHSKKNNGSKTK